MDGVVINKNAKNEINHFGLTVYKPGHPSIRRLKRLHRPSTYGNRVWETSWMLIDFLRNMDLPENLNVLEVGCGWGMPGIYCAKHLKARVTCMDKDAEVFPFLELHADVNRADVSFVKGGFESLTLESLSGVDVLLGAEICFWDEMSSELENLIETARLAGVRLILIADPGRAPFEVLDGFCLGRYNQGAVSWRIQRPYVFNGRILALQ